MKNVLIIEDDSLIANIYRDKLQMEGFAVEIASDGEAALQQLRAKTPDVVLLDLMLPKVDGVQVIKFIRAQPAVQSLPIIVLSNGYAGNLIHEAWKAGANRCLRKAQCSPNQLVSEVRNLLVEVQNAAAKQSPPHDKQTDALPLPEDAFQGSLIEQFLRQAPQQLTTLRALFQRVVECQDSRRVQRLFDLFRSIHSVAGAAALAGSSHVAQMACAMEALIKELHDKPKKINPSCLRTIAQAVDFLGNLLSHQDPGAVSNTSSLILVLDDDTISRETVCSALEKASLRALSVDDPVLALKLLEQNHFDLIFTDVDMPEMNGFEFCKRLKTTSTNQNTPVVFVTSLSDFDTRARTSLSGGADLIAKPFLLIELAVKALPYILKNQLRPTATT